MWRKNKVKTTPMKITLTDPELLCLKNLRKAGKFRSDSSTVGEVLRFVQQLRDYSPDITALIVNGKRFGIYVKGDHNEMP